MPWIRVQSLPQTFPGSDGNPRVGAYLKAYETGTTTPATIAGADTGTPTYSQLITNSAGYLGTSGGVRVEPFVDRAVDIYLYPDQATADADATGSAVWVLTDFDPFNVAGVDNSASSVTATGSTTARTLADRAADVFHVNDYGAVENSAGAASANATAWQAAIDAAVAVNGKVIANPGIYYSTGGIRITDDLRLESLAPMNGTTFRKTTHTTLGTDAVDAVLYLDNGGSGYVYRAQIQGIRFEGPSTSDRAAYVLYAPAISQSSFRDCMFYYGNTGVYVGDGWLCSMDSCEVGYCGDTSTGAGGGIDWRAGTSFSGRNLWVRNCVGTKGYYFYNTSYSTLTSCGLDNCVPAAGVLVMYYADVGSEFTLNGCGAESSTGVRVKANYARIVVNGWNDFSCAGIADNGRGCVETAAVPLVLINSVFSNYTSTVTQQHAVVSAGGSIVKIESSLPTNGGSFPGTSNAYGWESIGGRIKLLKQTVTAYAKFMACGSASVQNGSTIAHTLGLAPVSVSLIASNSSANVSVSSVDNTNITVAMRDTITDALITSNQTVYWVAYANET